MVVASFLVLEVILVLEEEKKIVLVLVITGGGGMQAPSLLNESAVRHVQSALG